MGAQQSAQEFIGLYVRGRCQESSGFGIGQDDEVGHDDDDGDDDDFGCILG